jgi:hypothetical protein
VKVVLITGSRSWDDEEAVARVLYGAELLIVGDANGADQIALMTALAWDIIPAVYCADADNYEAFQRDKTPCFLSPVTWQKDRKKAGPIRNAMMVRRTFEERLAGMDVHCHAFPGPKSVGTYDCAAQLEAAGFTVNYAEVKAA